MDHTISIHDAYRSLVQDLNSIYPPNEAKNIASYLFEDLFDISDINSNCTLIPVEVKRFNDARARLLNHEPLQYITRKANFMGLELMVDENVLIPRPETEELVYLIKQEYSKIENIKLLDIGTGSGCIPIYLASEFPSWDIHAWDISEKALAMAQLNADFLGLDINFKIQDILDADTIASDLKFEIIVSNPPYIGKDELPDMDPNVIKFEPHLALFAEDALQFYKAIAVAGRKLLNENGKLYFELNPLYSNKIKEIMQSEGYKDIVIHNDISGKERMLKAEWK